jgi:hypothetical protein
MIGKMHSLHRGTGHRFFRPPPQTSKPNLECLEDRTLPSAFWGSFAENAQHTALAPVPTQSLNRILWQTPVDLNPQYSGGDLLIHYGSPLVTLANTVIVPVKTGATAGFMVTGHNGATGALLWTEPSDYSLPPHDWVPSYSPVLTLGGRLYFAGAGGTVYYIDNVDSTTPTPPVQLAYYGLANYQANASAYNSTVSIDTPLTADSAGDIFFGVRVSGSNPANLASGIVRIDATGHGTWVSASLAAGDSSSSVVPHNSAPALSNDQTTLYIAVSSASTNSYLLGLDSTSLATKYKTVLWDPRYVGSQPASLLDDGTSSPMVGPDGDVYYGVFGNPNNGSRGWLTHFNATLTQAKTVGAFGWDSTPALVPAAMVPGYTGTSSYLVFEKYNNYASQDGGDGVNRIAILDPNATMVEPHASSNGLRVMNVVMSIAGPTPDASSRGSGYPNAVREWCINTGLVDPATRSILVPSEDGNLYRWNLSTGTLSQEVTVDPSGIGEAYVPTLEGPNGTVYTIENAQLLAVGGMPGALSLAVTSSANPYALSGNLVTFTAQVTSSSGPPPTGTMTFKDGSTVLATQTVSSSGNTYTTNALTVGNHFISAVYSGDSQYSAGSTTLVQAVITATSTSTNTTLASSVNPSQSGQALTFTATVTPTLSGTSAVSGIVLFKDLGTVLGTGTLNSSGQASFTTSALTVGSHTITAVYGGDTNFTTSTSSALPQIVIGETSVPVIIDNGQAGFAETGSWFDSTPGYLGNHRYANASDGSSTATWQLTSLAAGTYAVQASWPGWYNHATNATYRLYDGNTLRASASINQVLEPVGPSYNGRPFQTLANVQVNSGTLRIVLDNNANGYVAADAIRVDLFTPPTIDLSWPVNGFSGPSTVTTQTPFTLNRTYTISGTTAPSDFTISYYVSTDATFGNADDILLGSETITAATDKTVGNHTGTSPAFQVNRTGSYYLFAQLDSGNAINEIDKTNNVARAPQQLVVTGPTIIDNGQAGYSETGSWFDSTPGYLGNHRYANAGDGSSTAGWQLSGLASGTYTVQASWPGWPNHATNATYRLYDGNTLRASVSINQVLEPIGPSYNGRPFQALANVQVNSGTLRVVLDNNANGYVAADAVRIDVATPPSTDLSWPVNGISGPSTATSTQTSFTLNRTYTISGTLVPSDFTISYYASTDSTFGNADDNLLGSETISAAAEKTVGNHAGTSPPFQINRTGRYYLFAQLDSGNAINETDKSNNVAEAAQILLVTGPTILDNGQPGYSETGSWFDSTPGYLGNHRYANAGNGSSTATWQRTGLAIGTYAVQASWPGWYNHATNATYRIYDGDTLRATVTINQVLEPVGPSYNGRPFQTLANLLVSSGTLRIVLDDAANGYVVADAIRVEFIG